MFGDPTLIPAPKTLLFNDFSNGIFASATDFLTTNSPGVSNAGTLSVMPVPGTMLPLANLREGGLCVDPLGSPPYISF